MLKGTFNEGLHGSIRNSMRAYWEGDKKATLQKLVHYPTLLRSLLSKSSSTSNTSSPKGKQGRGERRCDQTNWNAMVTDSLATNIMNQSPTYTNQITAISSSSTATSQVLHQPHQPAQLCLWTRESLQVLTPRWSSPDDECSVACIWRHKDGGRRTKIHEERAAAPPVLNTPLVTLWPLILCLGHSRSKWPSPSPRTSRWSRKPKWGELTDESHRN